MRGVGEERVEDIARVFYRLVKSDQPDLDDFVSNEARGRRLPNPTPERVWRWSGVSAYLTPEGARGTARMFPQLGRFVAELRVGTQDAVQFAMWPDADDGHLTLWGEPSDLLDCVVRVFPADGEIT